MLSFLLGLDVCIRKPLIATCSLDRSVRIWNFETCSLELYKEFAEEAYAIALHPSGLYILVGFSDKLRLMNLLIDDIRTFKGKIVFSSRPLIYHAYQKKNKRTFLFIDKTDTRNKKNFF